MNILRLAGLATVFILGTFMVVMLRRDRRKNLKVDQTADQETLT